MTNIQTNQANNQSFVVRVLDEFSTVIDSVSFDSEELAQNFADEVVDNGGRVRFD